MTFADSFVELVSAAAYHLEMARWWRKHPARLNGDSWERRASLDARAHARDHYGQAIACLRKSRRMMQERYP